MQSISADDGDGHVQGVDMTAPTIITVEDTEPFNGLIVPDD